MSNNLIFFIMKRIYKISAVVVIMMAITIQFSRAGAPGIPWEDFQDPQKLTTVKGIVVDTETGVPLIFATVALQNSNVATVTNLDGEFLLKIDKEAVNPNIEITYIGYNNKVIPLSDLRLDGRDNRLELTQATIPIREVVIRPIKPEEIINTVIRSISKNYTDVPNLMTSFYRETIRRNRNYVSIAEAVVEILKAPYSNEFRFDMSRVYKGRKNVEVSRLDTVLFKLQGGPVSTLQLDLIKNPYTILTYDAMKSYNYKLESIIVIDDRLHYVIEFYQKPEVDTPMFLGKLFVDIDTYALTEAEFSINLDDVEKASEIFIRKKPLGMKVTPEMASYRVKFREQDGKWYFAYGRAEVRFKCDWQKKLFNTSYTTMSEIAVTDRTEEEVIKFASQERIRRGDIFIEKLSAFADPDFWGDYNVIEPDQSIESAIRRLSRRLRFSDREGE